MLSRQGYDSYIVLWRIGLVYEWYLEIRRDAEAGRDN